MRFLKNLSLLTLVVSFPLLALGASSPTICLTGRIVKNLPSYGQSFIDAAHLAVEQSQLKQPVTIKSFFYDNRPLAPLTAYQKMLKANCSAIIGFEYLSDLLLVAKTQSNKTLPIFTSYASTLGNDDLPENIFIFRPSCRFFAKKMLDFLQHKYGHLGRVLLVTEVSRDAMKAYQQAYIEQFKKRHIQYSTFKFLENDKNVVKELNQFLAGKQPFHFVFLLSGAIASAKVANALNDQKTIFIGTENHGSSSAQSFYIRLTNKNIQSYFIRNLDLLKASKKLQGFEKLYEDKYHQKPLLLSAYTYDATQIILQAIKSSGSVSLKNIFNVNYNGATGVKVKSGKFYQSPDYIILKVSPNGYQYVE